MKWGHLTGGEKGGATASHGCLCKCPISFAEGCCPVVGDQISPAFLLGDPTLSPYDVPEFPEDAYTRLFQMASVFDPDSRLNGVCTPPKGINACSLVRSFNGVSSGGCKSF